MPTIEYSDLTLGSEIGEGANAKIYEIDSINGLSGPRRMVLKKYKTSPKKTDLENLTELIRFRDALSSEDRALLDSAILWPTALVKDGPRIVGNLMERLPDEAMETDGGKSDAIGVVTLMGREKHCAAADVKGRLRVVSGMLYCLAALHKLGVVYGDLSPANAVLIPETGRVLLVDSDVCKVPSSPAGFIQGHTYPLTPPEQRNRPDSQSTQAGDIYKIAEMAARMMLNRAQLVNANEVYDALELGFGQSVANGLGYGMVRNPAERPSAWELYSIFYSALAALIRPPELNSVSVNPYGVIEGQAVTLSWEGMGIVEVEVVGPCGERISVPSGETSVTVPARATGRFEVIAWNDEGEVAATSPRVICVSRPTVQSIEVPELFAMTRAISGLGDNAARYVESAVDTSVAVAAVNMPSYESAVQKVGARHELEALPSLKGVFDNNVTINFSPQVTLEELDSSSVNRALKSQVSAAEKVSAQIRRSLAS